jgi:hypothetical protein
MLANIRRVGIPWSVLYFLFLLIPLVERGAIATVVV